MGNERIETFKAFCLAYTTTVHDPNRVIYCAFRGDPNDVDKTKWRARVLNDPENIDPMANIYFCISAMRQNDLQEYRRRKENFAGGICLMIDDLGNGMGSKNDLDEIVKTLPPSALIETSPDNFQAIYLFDKLETDIVRMDGLIRAFIAEKFLSNDPGMSGVNRVFRPPFGINGKKKYEIRRENGRGATTLQPFIVSLNDGDFHMRYSVKSIIEAFNLKPYSPLRRRFNQEFVAGEKGDRIRAFVTVRQQLKSAGMILDSKSDLAGWMPVVCPWVESHTAFAITGAAIREPSAENDWWGAFKCHHGHCVGKGWRELTEWLTSENEIVLNQINEAAMREVNNGHK